MKTLTRGAILGAEETFISAGLVAGVRPEDSPLGMKSPG